MEYLDGVFFQGDEAQEFVELIENQSCEDAQAALWDFCAFEGEWVKGEPQGSDDNVRRFAVDGETFALVWNCKIPYVGIHQYREISQAAAEYIALYAQDVREYPEHFKARVVADPEGTALRSIEGFNDDEIRRFTRELKEDRRAIAKHAGAAS